MSTDTVVENKTTTSRKIQEPKKFKVIVCNDDYTPMNFVVAMLVIIFKHNEEAAQRITMTVHETGSAVAGTYNFEIAEQKAIDGINLARAHGYPLLLKVEKE